MIRAIDVSRHQRTIDWEAVKNDGVQAAWIKVAGADDGLYRDSRARANLAGASDAGVPHGTYYFFVPGADTPEAQARHGVDHGAGTGELWPAIDVETNPHGLPPEAIDHDVTLFCEEVRRLTGRESIAYTYTASGLIGFTPKAPRHCRLWIANYGTNKPGTTPPLFNPRLPPAWTSWSVWQFNSRTAVAGIAGDVDQNVITDEFWAEMTAGASPVHNQEDHDMDTLIVDGREGRLSAWLLSGRFKTWVPGVADGGADFNGLLSWAANAGRGDVKTPPAGEGGVLQGVGSPWIARLDLAKLTNPEETPRELGGTRDDPAEVHRVALRETLARCGLPEVADPVSPEPLPA